MAKDLVQDERITAIGLFGEAFSGLTARLAAQLAEHHLTTVEFEVLIRLSRSPNRQLRMTDLSSQTSLTTSGVTRVVDRLERDGLVCRLACASDRRSSYAALTQSGLGRLESVVPGHLALIEQWFTGLFEPARLYEFMSGLRLIRDAVRPGAVAGADPVPVPGPDGAAGDEPGGGTR